MPAFNQSVTFVGDAKVSGHQLK